MSDDDEGGRREPDGGVVHRWGDMDRVHFDVFTDLAGWVDEGFSCRFGYHRLGSTFFYFVRERVVESEGGLTRKGS